jgi:hypothetical protein
MRWRFALVISLLTVFAGCGPGGRPERHPARSAELSGGAWLVKEDGQSEILRGIDIFLCRSTFERDVASEIRTIVITRQRAIGEMTRVGQAGLSHGESAYSATMRKINLIAVQAFQAETDALTAMNRKASQSALKATKTGVDGRYTLSNVADGSFTLFAAFQYNSALGCWLVPVSVQGGVTIPLDLENSNLTMTEFMAGSRWKLSHPPTTFPESWIQTARQ